jgi:hypothetical protein
MIRDDDDPLDNLADDKDVVRGRTPHQMLYDNITSPKHETITYARQWLEHELQLYVALQHDGLLMCRNKMNHGLRPITLAEFARYLMRDYYRATRASILQGVGSHPPVDIEAFLDLLMAHETIKKTIDKMSIGALP